jgi:hypothetical protein
MYREKLVRINALVSRKNASSSALDTHFVSLTSFKLGSIFGSSAKNKM